MAQQQIITKPHVGELQDNDSLFINHDGALRQIKKSDADFASGADMRAEVAARETFEAQEVAAREAFEKSETDARKSFESNIEGQVSEEAEPFQNIQIVDDFGTEEFVSTGIVPVGHNTRYPANLRDKLQHLPSLASTDGVYLIQQSGKQMSLIHMPSVLPNAPTDDGAYTLKTVVTGGVATLQWVTE